MSDNPNSRGLSSEVLSLTNQTRLTVPIGSSLSNPQRKGSLIWDSRLKNLYISNGEEWQAVVAVDSSGDTTVPIQEIESDFTSVSVVGDDGSSEANTIQFVTNNTTAAIFNDDGVLIVTAGGVDPNTITPAAGKVAHIEGDVKITGVMDPIGLELDEQSSTPLDPTGTTTGVLYVKDNSPNVLVFVDNSGVEHVLSSPGGGGDVVGPGSATDNAITRFDGTTGKLIQNSTVTLDDAGAISGATSISNPAGTLVLAPGGGASVQVTGNLDVQGTTTTIDSTTVNIADNCLYLNNGNVVTSPVPGCVVVNYLATATSDTITGNFVAGVAATSNPTVQTTSASTFAAGDIIQISGANLSDNNGLFEVDSHAANLLTIRGVGTTSTTFNMFQDQFAADATAGGTITLVNVSAISSGSDGVWETSGGASNTGAMSFADLLRTGDAAGGSLSGTYPNPGIANSGVGAGTYGDASNVAQITVGADGRITSAGNVPIAGGSQNLASVLSTGPNAGETGANDIILSSAVNVITTSANTVPLTVRGAASTGLSAGSNVVIEGGDNTGSNGPGGAVNITAGSGGSTFGNGGNVVITGGSSSSNAANTAGGVQLVGGTNSGTRGDSGDITFTTPTATGTGNPGDVVFDLGDHSGPGSPIGRVLFGSSTVGTHLVSRGPLPTLSSAGGGSPNIHPNSTDMAGTVTFLAASPFTDVIFARPINATIITVQLTTNTRTGSPEPIVVAKSGMAGNWTGFSINVQAACVVDYFVIALA